MGVHVVLTGQGCRALESMACFLTWEPWVKELTGKKGRIRRADFAIDDRIGVLEMAEIEAKLRAREWTGRSRLYDIRASVSGDEREGITAYVGARTSTALVRIYDKAVQTGTEGPWVRVELQLRNERAEEMMGRFAGSSVAEQGALISGVIRNYLEFKEPGEHKQRTRWAPCKWWLDFLGGVDAVSVVGASPVDSMERRRDWLRKSVAPSLALVWMEDGRGYDFINELIRDGTDRLTEQGHALVENPQGKLKVLGGNRKLAA